MKKREISIAAESGTRLDGSDVVRVSRRDRNVLIFRHVWPEDVDARVWHGVKTAAMRLAGEIADRTGRPVEIYAAEGHMVESVEPQ